MHRVLYLVRGIQFLKQGVLLPMHGVLYLMHGVLFLKHRVLYLVCGVLLLMCGIHLQPLLIMGDGDHFQLQKVGDNVHHAESSCQLIPKEVCFQHFELLDYGDHLI
jgi:hypothetical protein